MVKECRYFTWTQFEHPSFSLLAFYWPYNLADKNIFLKRLQNNLLQTMGKIWISRIFTLNNRSGPNTCNTSCSVKLSNCVSEPEHLRFANCGILKNKRKLVLFMALCVFLRILFTELAVLILTKKGILKSISWHIMELVLAKFQETEIMSSDIST